MTPHLAGTPALTTANLSLRAPVAEDWPFWDAFARSARARSIGGPHSAPTSWRAFGHVIGHWVLRGFGMFVFCRHGDRTPLGMAGPWFPEGWPEKELGWSVWSADAEGTGIAFEAATAARRHAYETLGWSGAVSYIDHGNDRSVALAKRLGAKLDVDAARPEGSDCQVFRHPEPEALP